MYAYRDIKGANLLVDSAGVVKLADFGMAKHVSSKFPLSLICIFYSHSFCIAENGSLIPLSLCISTC